jgi:1,2-phenylacetyl-CoA epoxidase PaaB subunit
MTVPTEKNQNTTLSEQFQHPRKTTKYHTVRTAHIEKQQNTTLSDQFQHL